MIVLIWQVMRGVWMHGVNWLGVQCGWGWRYVVPGRREKAEDEGRGGGEVPERAKRREGIVCE